MEAIKAVKKWCLSSIHPKSRNENRYVIGLMSQYNEDHRQDYQPNAEENRDEDEMEERVKVPAVLV